MHQPHQTHSSAAFVTFRARHAPRLRQTASHARPATFSQTHPHPAHVLLFVHLANLAMVLPATHVPLVAPPVLVLLLIHVLSVMLLGE
jgi:hypothetical protein